MPRDTIPACSSFTRWPKLQALRSRIESDPAVLYALELEDGGTPPGTGACVGHVALEEVVMQFGS